MDLRICVQPQVGTTYGALRAAAQATREAGLSGFFRADHILGMGPRSGPPGPPETLTSLAALAAHVPDIRLGTLVASATFRHPSMLAAAIATIDDISGGRVELGLGSGWYEAENTAYGLPFPSAPAERFDRLTEQLAIITGLWATPTDHSFTYTGRHYQLAGAPGLPKPTQTTAHGKLEVPIIIGGHGKTRTPRLAAQFGDEINVANADLTTSTQQFSRVTAACDRIGRDHTTITRSVARLVITGTNPTEIRRRAATIGRNPDELGDSAFIGTIPELIDALGTWSEAGVQRAYLQILDITDVDHIRLIGTEIAPHLCTTDLPVREPAVDSAHQ